MLVGEKVWSLIGPLPPKDKTQLEERLRRVAGPSSHDNVEPLAPPQIARLTGLPRPGSPATSSRIVGVQRPASPATSSRYTGVPRLALLQRTPELEAFLVAAPRFQTGKTYFSDWSATLIPIYIWPWVKYAVSSNASTNRRTSVSNGACSTEELASVTVGSASSSL